MSDKADKSSFLYGSNAIFIEELYIKYLHDKTSVDQSWVEYFEQIDGSGLPLFASWGIHPRVIGVTDIENANTTKTNAAAQKPTISSDQNYFKARFILEAYRERGHYLAKLDPLGMEKTFSKADIGLSFEAEGLNVQDFDESVNLRGKHFGIESCKLSEFVSLLDNVYTKSIGFECSHVESSEEREWLYSEIEEKKRHFSVEEKKELFQDLVEVEGFEQYLHVKFPGAKRFSVEGVDSTILSLQKIVEFSAARGVHDIVIGMAHRGRLSTLTKIMGKPYSAVFSEFMGNSAIPKELNVSGDVKYHIGYSYDRVTKQGNKVHISLAYNPSHLEAINPVVAGMVRAKQDLKNDVNRKNVVGILIHGDAAFCGQGIVAESLSMSGLDAYNVGGIFHIITNNQIGFTAGPQDQHIGRYATDIAKSINAPILHVNADDVESVMLATEIALKYRDKFGKDVVLDIIGYRKYGHNEGDEPMYTQPVMYNIIKVKETAAALYAKSLSAEGVIQNADYQNAKDMFKQLLEQEYELSKSYKPKAQWLEGLWNGYTRLSNSKDKCITGVSIAKLKDLISKLCTISSNFTLNSKLLKLFEQRKTDVLNANTVDWAAAEQLAFATLLSENTPIRLTGEDACRGTFSHRHSVLHDQKNGERYIPFNNLSDSYAKYEVADSNLSEYGVLGFEYGYSLVDPKQLTIWEAQFGDFANGAQIIFDQFISAAETKWLRMSGLVVLLPHGWEGMGPEHSSARLERFLQLCAENNMCVINPTTPASLFHILRRHMHSTSRVPLIVMTPKSLLRHKLVVSDLKEFDVGTSFREVIGEIDQINPKDVKRVIICSGKVYYDIIEKRREAQLNIAVIRIEQYYPFPKEQIAKELSLYTQAKEFIWCQEEPKNMGAWSFIAPYLDEVIHNDIEYIGRPASASPAVGSAYLHIKEQEALVRKALNIGE